MRYKEAEIEIQYMISKTNVEQSNKFINIDEIIKDKKSNSIKV